MSLGVGGIPPESYITLIIVIVIIWGIITGVIFFLTRHHRRIRKYYFFSTISFVLAISLWLVYLGYEYPITRLKRQIISEIPQDVRNQTDKYIINIIGENQFKNNLIFSSKDSYKIGSQIYEITYEFIPLREYQSNPLIHLKSTESVITTYSEIPNCQADPTLCNFNLTKDELSAIKRKLGIVEEVEFEPPYLKAFVCSNQDNIHNKTYLIDYRTKDIEYQDSRFEDVFSPCSID